ncbi:hypothetical protein SK128_009129 [Halocaridina rubra]|uniref:Ankyrin repeat protein n=1 Tax=Halocaridina rubra TaxID=373956 RepID=A0AAN8WK52_HALRR
MSTACVSVKGFENPIPFSKMGKMPHILDLHQAILTGDKEAMRRLVESGIDLGASVRGTTALSLAVYHGKLDAVVLLTEADAPLDRRSKDHLERIETPLISSIRLGHREIFEILVRKGARLDIRDFYNQTPLWFAVKEQRLSFVRVLLDNGAPINYKTATENPINIAMQFMGYRGRREMALELVAAGIPLTCEDYKGHCPLYYAMKYADFHFFRLLVEAGAPLKKFEWFSLNLIPASWRQNPDIMTWLKSEVRKPPPLRRQCRSLIYTHLRRTRNRDVRPLIKTLPEQLPLPSLIVKYLLLEDPLVVAAQNPPGSLMAQEE